MDHTGKNEKTKSWLQDGDGRAILAVVLVYRGRIIKPSWRCGRVPSQVGTGNVTDSGLFICRGLTPVDRRQRSPVVQNVGRELRSEYLKQKCGMRTSHT